MGDRDRNRETDRPRGVTRTEADRVRDTSCVETYLYQNETRVYDVL